jgi:hypothetical protein
VLDWLRRSGRRAFTERDVYRGVNRFRSDPESLTQALRTLCDARIIRPIPHPSAARGGRAGLLWQVNPRWGQGSM